MAGSRIGNLTWVRDLARLALPVECPGCAAPDVLWCANCAGLLGGEPRRVEATAPRLDWLDGREPIPVWAVCDYVGPVRRLIVAWKDRGRTDLDRLLVPAAARCAQAAARHLQTPQLSAPLLVVPAPSSNAARRERAREHLSPIAKAVAAQQPAAIVRPLLRRNRARDQVGLGARGRGSNVAVALRRNVPGPGRQPLIAGAPTLLVDDVLTTGATLAAAKRALEAGGHPVVGAVVLAATPAPQGDTTR